MIFKVSSSLTLALALALHSLGAVAISVSHQNRDATQLDRRDGTNVPFFDMDQNRPSSLVNQCQNVNVNNEGPFVSLDATQFDKALCGMQVEVNGTPGPASANGNNGVSGGTRRAVARTSNRAVIAGQCNICGVNQIAITSGVFNQPINSGSWSLLRAE